MEHRVHTASYSALKPMDNPIRCFIAISLPEEVKNRLIQVQSRIKTYSGFRAGYPGKDGLHITLQFFGDVFPKALEKIISAMEKSVPRGGFYLKTSGLGVFPENQRHARILWGGICGDVSKLQGTYNALERSLLNERIIKKTENKPFTPHITIARFKSFPSPKCIDTIIKESGIDLDNYRFKVSAIHLYQSQLTPKGARYTRLHTSCF